MQTRVQRHYLSGWLAATDYFGRRDLAENLADVGARSAQAVPANYCRTHDLYDCWLAH